MTFLTSYRAEKIYFEKLRSNIDIAKSYIQRGATDEVMALLQNAVDADGAIMLCYRNLGEVWADLAAQLEKTQKALEDLKVALEEYHDDLNNKIDEINNYLVRLINALDERVTILENESKVKFAYLLYDSEEDDYSIQYNGETADFDAISDAMEYPHLLVLIDNDNGNIFYPRSVSDSLIDFHADGVSGSDYVDLSVTMTESDVVTVTAKTVVNYTFGTGFNVSSANEVTPDLTVLQAKLTAGTGVNLDTDTNEISVDFSEVQAKLTAGTGIEISAQNEISSTVKGNFAVKVTEDSNNVLTSDKSYAQIKAAIDAGENIILSLVEYAQQDVEKIFKLQDNDETSGSEVLAFVYDEIDNGVSATQTVLTITSVDAVSKTDNVLTSGGSYTAGNGIEIDTNNSITNTYPGVFPSYDSTSYAASSAERMSLIANGSYTSEQTGRKLYKALIGASIIQVPAQTKKIVGVTMNVNSPGVHESATDTTQGDRETQWYGNFDIFATLTFTKTGVANITIEEFFGGVVFTGMVDDSDAVHIRATTSNLYNNIEGYANKGYTLSFISVNLRGYVTVIGTNSGANSLNRTTIINFLNTKFTTRPQLLLSNI